MKYQEFVNNLLSDITRKIGFLAYNNSMKIYYNGALVESVMDTMSYFFIHCGDLYCTNYGAIQMDRKATCHNHLEKHKMLMWLIEYNRRLNKILWNK